MYVICYSMFTSYFKCVMQSKGPNTGQLWLEITTSVCNLFKKYTWVSLCIVLSLIRILSAQRTYTWVLWNQRRNTYFCIGNTSLHIDNKANELFNIFLIFCVAVFLLLPLFIASSLCLFQFPLCSIVKNRIWLFFKKLHYKITSSTPDFSTCS